MWAGELAVSTRLSPSDHMPIGAGGGPVWRSAPVRLLVCAVLAFILTAAKDLDSTARLEADRRARTGAVKANRLAPNDPEALHLFYVTFAHEAAGPSKNAIDGLTQAYEYLPQYQPTAQLLARQQLHDGKPDMAVSILEPIAYSPHGGPGAQKLRDWIAEIKAKESPAPAATPAGDSKDRPH